MKVSVVIPVYNAENYIAETIESALDQTIHDHEVIVVNDGSTDGSAAVIAGYGDHIVYLEQSNSGVSAARNAGIQSARGEYVAFLDQDDVFEADRLEKLAAFLDEHPDHATVYSMASRIDSAGQPLPAKPMETPSGDIFRELFIKSHIAPSMIMCRREALITVGMFSEDFSSEGEDYDLMLRLAQHSPIGVVMEDLVRYRVHPTNTCKQKEDIAPYRYEEILNRYRQYLFDNYADGQKIYRKRMSKVFREKARLFRDHGDFAAARKWYDEALKVDPLRLDALMERIKLVGRSQAV